MVMLNFIYIFIVLVHQRNAKISLRIHAFTVHTADVIVSKSSAVYSYMLHKKQRRTFHIRFYRATINHNLKYYDRDHVLFMKRRVKSAPSVKLDCWNILFYYLNRFHGYAIECSFGFFFTVYFNNIFSSANFLKLSLQTPCDFFVYRCVLCAERRENFEFH